MSDEIKKCPKCGNECAIGDLYCIKCRYKFGSDNNAEKLDRMKRVDDYSKSNLKEDDKKENLDVTMQLDLTYEESLEGAQKTVVLDYFDPPKEIKVNIPASVKNGTKIKLDGEGYENEKGEVGDLYIVIKISNGNNYYSESNNGVIWFIVLAVIGLVGFGIFKFLSNTNADKEITDNMPKPLSCDNYSIKSSVINNFKENNLYYKYIDENSVSEIDLLYPSEIQYDEENGIYYCKGVITVKSNQDGFKANAENDKNNYYAKIHQINNENGEEKLLKYTKYEYNIEYKSYISDGEPAIEVINSSDDNVGEFYCNGNCEPEIIKEAEVYNTYEEDYSNNYNYENNNNVNQERENAQNRNQNNTRQRSYNNVDFSNYMSNIENRIKNNWYPPKSNTTSRAVVLFELNRNGEVISAKIKQSSGNALCDRAAISAIENTHFDPLPSEFEGESVPIEFSFDYNVVNHR